MILLNNKKGMTLVEIIVVLLIMSITLIIMGSLILSAFANFDKTTKQDLSERALDSVAKYVRSELLYAKDIRVQNDALEGETWNVLSIEEGHLFKNGEQVFQDGFYNDNALKVNVRGFEKYRLDITYSFENKDNDNIYHTQNTLELLNLKMTIEEDDKFDPFQNISSTTQINERTKIYYSNEIEENDEDEPESESSVVGTVGDEIKCINEKNLKVWEPLNVSHNNHMNFPMGSYVEYPADSGIYYKAVRPATNEFAPDFQGVHAWKKITMYWDINSMYESGDIVWDVNDEEYYRVKINGWVGNTQYPPSSPYASSVWKEIDEDDVKENNACRIIY